jgi:hypothetical protein
MASQTVMAVYILYGSLVVAFAGGLYAIHRGAVLEPPEFVTRPIAMLSELLQRRLQPS